MSIRTIVFASIMGASMLVWAQSPPKKNVLRLEGVKVEGRIRKPQAFYILQRSKIQFQALDIHQSFVESILTSPNEKPF